MRSLLLAHLAAVLVQASSLAAQATADQARLTLSLGIGGTSGGGNLWRVGQQPLAIDSVTVDTLAVGRRFRSSLAVVFSGTYFPGNHFGFNVEAQLLGLGTRDDCTIVSAGGFTRLFTTDVCSTINNSTRSATSAALSVGGIYRVWSRARIHPYVRANAGFVVSQESFIRTQGIYTDASMTSSTVTLYEDSHASTVQPYFSAGGGLVAVIAPGYQVRLEARNNWVRVPAITGPTAIQGVVPQSQVVGRQTFTFLVNFDVVLERKRGRRY